MDEQQKANTTALPADDRPEVHEAGLGTGHSSPISLEQDKKIRDGSYRRLDDERMRDLPDESDSSVLAGDNNSKDEKGPAAEGSVIPGSVPK
jgi:hypothetical protein